MGRNKKAAVAAKAATAAIESDEQMLQAALRRIAGRTSAAKGRSRLTLLN